MKYLLLLFCLSTNVLFAQKTSLEFKASALPTLFGGGVVSDGFENRDMTLSPANDELFYTLQHPRRTFSVVLHSKKMAGQWTAPEVASFSGRFNDLEPAFSPDGNTLFFTSNRPLKEGDTLAKDYDLWYLKKKGLAWEGPFNMGTIINGGKDEFYASCARNGNLYFTRDNGDRKDDIFVCEYRNGAYLPPVALSESVNSKEYEFNAFVDPDENYLLFSSYKRKGDYGGGDLYISLRKGPGSRPFIWIVCSTPSPWTTLLLFPSIRNISSLPQNEQQCPFLSKNRLRCNRFKACCPQPAMAATTSTLSISKRWKNIFIKSIG